MTKANVEGSCNVEIHEGTSGLIASPGFPHSNYSNDVICTYRIVAPVGSHIAYRSLYMDLERRGRTNCYDAVNIHFVDDDNSTLGLEQYCDQEEIFIDATPGNTLLVEFFSDDTVSASGFVIEWTVVNPAAMPPQLNCDFDGAFALCPGWTQIQSDDNFDWSFTRGSTPTRDTGPYFDHNTESGEGRYAFIEASGVTMDQFAQLASPPIDGDLNHCLQFWYHARGKGVGSLAVIRKFDENNHEVLWLSGPETSEDWQPVNLTLPVTFYTAQIIFEATRGNSFFSDLAIDDIKFNVGLCVNSQSLLDAEETTQALTQLRVSPSTHTTQDCEKDEFACIRSNECIKREQVCDDIIDCTQGSDEDWCFSEWCPGNQYWGACVDGCNYTCADGPTSPLCVRKCAYRCACPPGAPVLHNGWCIQFSECPSDIVTEVITRQTKEKVHGEVMTLYEKIGYEIKKKTK
uniref:MAM and LDL-receptor class A domain-containing protein 2 n=1 Tax=Phallusia mammillata TaxID=59560 RepID=A0A6F9DJJ7_9ASCI|nr:MAM and LDL-receptor class A domain-containing protein 2 [Phallusia mammillata]